MQYLSKVLHLPEDEMCDGQMLVVGLPKPCQHPHWSYMVFVIISEMMLISCRVTPILEERSPQRTATQDPLVPPPSSPLRISSTVAPVPAVPAASTRRPPSTRSVEGINHPEAGRERLGLPGSHNSIGEESDDSQITAGSMRVQELTTRTSSPQQKV